MRIKISDALIYLTRDVISNKALQCFDLRWFCHNIKGESMLFGKLKNVVSKHT